PIVSRSIRLASRTRSAPSPACFHSPPSKRCTRIFVAPFRGIDRVTRRRSPSTSNSSATAILGWPWLTISRIGVSLPLTRSTSPNSAYVIASSTLDLPDPVGPTMANGLSSASKSITCSSRNDVNPLISSRSGRTVLGVLLGELVERGHQRAVRLGAVRDTEVGQELVA